MEAKLIVIGGKANKSEVKLKLPTTIGRSRQADLTVAHPKVSRQHCQIFERNGLLMVRDNGSLNGTYIENNRITESILKPGDKLTVGPLTFVAVYEHSGELPVASPDTADEPTPLLEPIEPILPPTVRQSVEEADADDLSWLEGQDAPAAPSSADLQGTPRANAQAGPPAPTLDLEWLVQPDADLPADALPPSRADAVRPSSDSQDFGWLDNAKDQPLDFSAFECKSVEGSDPAAAPGRAAMPEPGPTVALPKPESGGAASSGQPKAGEATMTFQSPSRHTTDLSFEVELPSEDANAPLEFASPPPDNQSPASDNGDDALKQFFKSIE